MTDTEKIATQNYIHKTVLLHETIDGLNIQKGDIYLDGTLGSAGHALAALDAGAGTIVGIDEDSEALERSKGRLNTAENSTGANSTSAKIFLIKDNYRNLDKVLDTLAIAKVNRIVLDLGLSSDQFETSGRGFSFQKNEPLSMTFKSASTTEIPSTSDANKYTLTAREIINKWDESNIADIIYGYGDERYARRIARRIVEVRAERPIETTFDLVEIIKSATPNHYHHGKIHPATRTFQALRITVNDEINALKDGLVKGFDRLLGKNEQGIGGRMAVISFHSIEDRIVKNFYKEKASEGLGTIITKKPIVASEQEESENPRSRSAKLRIIEKI